MSLKTKGTSLALAGFLAVGVPVGTVGTEIATADRAEAIVRYCRVHANVPQLSGTWNTGRIIGTFGSRCWGSASSKVVVQGVVEELIHVPGFGWRWSSLVYNSLGYSRANGGENSNGYFSVPARNQRGGKFRTRARIVLVGGKGVIKRSGWTQSRAKTLS